MRSHFASAETFRVNKFSCEGDGYGLFFIPSGSESPLRVLLSDGCGWDHVSIMHPDRPPTNQEVAAVRVMFWEREEIVVEYHDPLVFIPETPVTIRHLWCPQGCQLLRPPAMVASEFNLSEDEKLETYQKVESSNLAAVKYVADAKTLFVYDGLMEAESAGKFFHASIRGKFNDRKIEEDE